MDGFGISALALLVKVGPINMFDKSGFLIVSLMPLDGLVCAAAGLWGQRAGPPNSVNGK